MATETEIDIEIQLSGAQKVEKQIDDVQGGLKGLGETGSRLADSLGATNKQLGEGLENVGESVGELKDSFKSLGVGISNLGNTGAKGLLGLIGPLGAVVAAGVLVYETFRQITGAAQEAEDAQEAMAAAAGDLQSRFEALAEKGVIMAAEEVDKFSMAVLESQFRKEQIQKAQEKYAKSFEAIRFAIKNVRKSTEELRHTEQIYGKENETTKKKLRALEIAQNDLNYQRERAKIQVHELNVELEDYLHIIEKVSETEQKVEKRTTDSLKKDAIRLANLAKENDTIRFQNELKDDQIQLNEMLSEVQARNIKVTKDLEDANREQVKEILKSLKLEVGAADEVTLNEKKQAQERSKLRQEQAKKGEIERRRIYKQRLKQQEQQFKKEVTLQARIDQIQIKMKKSGIDQAFALESVQHQATLRLVKKNSLEEQLEEQRHELALRTISTRAIKEDEREREDELQKIQDQNLKKLELEYDLAQSMLELNGQPAATEFGQLQNEQQQRMVALELQYNREVDLARMKGEGINAINQEYAIERLNFDKQNLQERSDLVSDYFDKYGEGFAQAAVGAILFGDSFQESTAKVLNSLAEQAGVESIMSLAKGFAQLALSDPRASASFKAAALFGTAAVVAGAAGGALSGGGGTGASASPSGAPTTAPTPQREEVRNDAMVFNVNFGGAVVYDTKKAAEQALADRLVTILNQPRRGAPRINRR
jgi:hypothetical protein